MSDGVDLGLLAPRELVPGPAARRVLLGVSPLVLMAFKPTDGDWRLIAAALAELRQDEAALGALSN